VTTPPDPGAERAAMPAARAACRTAAGTAGLLGSLACGASMLLAAAGVGGTAAAGGMAAMTGPGAGPPGGALGVLVRAGPWLLAGSVLLVAAALALGPRPAAAAGGLLAGAVLYAGMYAQSSPAVMDASIAAGYLAWAGLFLWARGGRPGRQRPPAAATALPPGPAAARTPRDPASTIEKE
jgi:hypothetical protein